MSRELQLGDVMAERDLIFQPRHGAAVDVHVRIGRPVPDPSGPSEAWVCPFQIEGLGSGKTHGIFGVDAMQALLLAIHMIPVELSVFGRDLDGEFLYLGKRDA